MLKRLFLVIFIIQSFATGAWAGINMSQFNQAEKTQMQIMHHSMNMDEMKTMFSSDTSDMNSQIHSMMDCSFCDQNIDCSNLSCNSIHATTPFFAQKEITQSVSLIVSYLTPILSVSIKYSNSEPETPPPAV